MIFQVSFITRMSLKYKFCETIQPNPYYSILKFNDKAEKPSVRPSVCPFEDSLVSQLCLHGLTSDLLKMKHTYVRTYI